MLHNHSLITASLVLFKTPVTVLEQCFLSLPTDVPLVVVDNSPDSSLKTVIDTIPTARYHLARKNLGYGKGHNLAVAMAPPSTYHLIINPDIVITQGALGKMVDFMEQHQDIGLLGPRFLNPDGSTQFLNRRYPSVLDILARRLPQKMSTFKTLQRVKYHEMHDVGYDVVTDVPCMSGACMLFRRAALEEVGGFDIRYFMYCEDFDLCCSLRKSGWRTVYYPAAEMTHLWARSSAKEIRMTFEHIRSIVLFFNKWGWKWK